MLNPFYDIKPAPYFQSSSDFSLAFYDDLQTFWFCSLRRGRAYLYFGTSRPFLGIKPQNPREEKVEKQKPSFRIRVQTHSVRYNAFLSFST